MRRLVEFAAATTPALVDLTCVTLVVDACADVYVERVRVGERLRKLEDAMDSVKSEASMYGINVNWEKYDE